MITRETSQEVLSKSVHLRRAFMVPYSINDYVWIIVNKKPTRVLVTDVGINSIQLNGRWYDWDEAEKSGGVFESEFEALSHL